ncbi:hypothetical protein ACHAWT_010688 [Skeletonema menzelii]
MILALTSRAVARRRCRYRNICNQLQAAQIDDYSSYLAPSLTQVQNEIEQKRRLQHFSSSAMSTQLLDDGLAASKIGLDPYQNSRHAPTVYHEHYSCPNWPQKHTFPMSKFEQTAYSLLNDPDDLLQQRHPDDDRPLIQSVDDCYRPLEVVNFPLSFMTPPIHSNYLHRFLSGSLTKEECRKIGFREQTSRPELIERTVLEVAGTVLTAQLALRYGLACNVAGGTHHAEANEGKGFTILNDLAVASRLMTWSEDGNDDLDTDDDDYNRSSRKLLSKLYRGNQRVERVLVVDCDVHQGDGTATFHYQDNLLHGRLFTLDLHAENNWPFEKEAPTYDVPLPDKCSDEEYLSVLSTSLKKALNEVQPQLVLYNAGVDPFYADKLGRLSLSWQGLCDRDLHVIQTCVEEKLPVACVVGGGYSTDVREVARRHALVHRICAKVWRDNEMWRRC